LTLPRLFQDHPSVADCPNEDQLLAYGEGVLPAPEADAIALHLDACAACRSLFAVAVGGPPAPQASISASEAQTTPTDFAPGHKIGRYVVLDLIGKGAMGAVYAAYDAELDRKVALKLLHARFQASVAEDELRNRLVREARTMAQLSHPNVVAVYDVGTIGQDVFLAMDFVHGQTLRAWCQKSRRTWREIVRVFVEAGRGLAAAHEVGIIHRDFKADNVLIDQKGRVFVADFGLARGTRESGEATEGPASLEPGAAFRARMTATGAILGTPAYMAPEQYKGTATVRSDIYAFGIALYEALYGGHPFPMGSLAELRNAVQARNVCAPPKGTRVPKFLRRALLHALDPDPEARWERMDPFLAAISTDPRRRWRAIAAAVVVLGGAGLVYWQASPSRTALCTGSELPLEAVWDAPRREGLRAAFEGTGLAYAPETAKLTAAALDRYASYWVRARREACEATHVRGEQSGDLLDRRMQCLDDRLRDFGALVRTFTQADAKTVENAAQAVGRLHRIESCGDRRALLERVAPPEEARVRTKVEAVRGELAQARAAENAGRYGEARAVAERALGEARAIDYRPLVAEALYGLGRLRRALDENQAAVTSLHEAVTVALATRHDEVGVRAQILLGRALAAIGREDDAVRTSDQALARIEGAGNEPVLRAEALFQRSSIWGIVGRTLEAEGPLREAIGLLEAAIGREHTKLIEPLCQLSGVLMNSGRPEEAVRLAERAAALSQELLSPLHPQTALAIAQNGVALTIARRRSRALSELRRAQQIQVRGLPPSHENAQATRNNIAAALLRLGRYPEALQELDEALRDAPNRSQGQAWWSRLLRSWVLAHLDRLGEALQEATGLRAVAAKTVGTKHPLHAFSLHASGFALERQGRWLEALALHRQALPTLLAANDLDEAPVALLGEVRILRALGRHEEAQQRGAKALRLLEDRLGFGVDAAELSLELAKAWLARGQVAEARKLAVRSLALLESRREDVLKVVLAVAKAFFAEVLARAGDRATARDAARDAQALLTQAPHVETAVRKEVHAAISAATRRAR
jgi:tetratricopeptide (TPR) repeat protein/tRNA A-37 threonylcarbamoyl transferase component Bud32